MFGKTAAPTARPTTTVAESASATTEPTPKPTPAPEPTPAVAPIPSVVTHTPRVAPAEFVNWNLVFADKLRDPNPEVRAGIIDCAIGIGASDALPIIVGLMTDGDENIVAKPAGRAIVKLGDKAVPALINTGLLSGNEQLMDRSSMVLSRIGNPAVTALINVLSCSNERARYYAKKALFYIGSKSELVEIIRKDGDPVRTAEAYDTLSWIEKGKFVASWGPVSGPTTTSPRTEAVELKTELAEAREKLYEFKCGKVVYIDGVDKLVPATMSSRTFNEKLMSLPPKERLAVMKAREAYFRAMREP